MPAAWDDPRIARGMAAQMNTLRERRAAGAVSLGWKVGFGAPAALQRFGIEAPLVGFLLKAAQIDSGAAVSLAGWVKPAAEPEVGLVMARALGAGASREEAARAVGALAPCIELADVDHPPEDVAVILAGNIYQRHVIVGPRDATRAGCKLDGLLARVIRNGAETAATSDLQTLTGDYIDIVRHVANLLDAFGERLAAGQILITGSITPPLFVLSGEDLKFDLEPVGSVAVRFT